MSSEFNPIGRHCVVFTESGVNNFEEIEFQGEAVGFLEDHLGIQGSYKEDAGTIFIEWFPRSWLFSGRIKFYYSLKEKKLENDKISINTNHKTDINSNNKETEVVDFNIVFPLITPAKISNLPNPTFCSIVRFVARTGCLTKMFEEIVKAPSEEAVSQHTILTGNQEVVNISLVPDLDGMVSKEETGVNWLDTVEHMLVKFPNGSRTDACSGSVLHYSFNEKNAERFKNKSLSMSVTYLKIKKGNEKDLTEFLVTPTIHEQRILYCAIQVDEQKFIMLNKYVLDEKREYENMSLYFLDKIEHLLDSSKEISVHTLSGRVTEWYNDQVYLQR